MDRFLRATDRNRRTDHETFIYGRCVSCGSHTLLDPPADLSRYYPDDYVIWSSRDALRSRYPHEAYRLGFLTHHGVGPGSKILEIGPGDGLFASMATDAGMDVTAIERTPDACAELTQLTGATTLASDDPASALEAWTNLDAIVGWHVIEHLPRPADVLDAAARALRPGGLLVLAAPNPRSRTLAVMGAAWPHIDAPRHLTIPDPDGISGHLEGSMDVVALTDRDPGSAHWEGFAWHYRMRRPFLPPAIDTGLALAGGVIGRLSNAVDRRPLRGAAYSIVLRRR